MASTRVMRCFRACARRSGPASINTLVPASPRTNTDGRRRLSRGSSERQVLHSQPIIGTPCEVPVPRNVISKLGLDDPALALLSLDVAHPQLVEQVVNELGLVGRQVALRLLLQEADQVDHLMRGHEIRLVTLAAVRVWDVAEMHGRRGRER